MTEIQITLTVLSAVIFALAFLRTNPDVILLSGLSILMVLGIINPAEAFHGFANEGLATVGVLFVVAEGLRQTGGIGFLGQSLLGQPNHLRSAQARMTIPISVMSAFMNNTPVVAMTIPIVRDWARKLRISVSYLLLPLSYSAILGGLCTLVGTSTTLVVNGLLIEERGSGINMFEIAWVGFPAALGGLLYLIFFTRWILPQRIPAISKFENPREYSLEMLVEPGSPLVGKTIEAAGLRHLPSMYLLEIDREGHILAAVASSERLRAHDRLIFVGIVESVVDLQKIPGLKPATDQLFKLDSPREDRSLVEAVVSNSFPFLGTTIREARFRTRYNAAVIAVARNGERLNQKIGDIELLPGDTLLLEAHPDFVNIQRNSRDFFLVSLVSGSTPPRHERAWVARIILLAMVVSVTMGSLSMIKASLLAAAAMVITKCCKGSEARRAIDWSVLLTIGAGLGIGKAVQVSGTAALLSDHLIEIVGNNPYVVLIAIYLVTMVLTNIITAKAAAVLVFPIAITAASQLETNIMPFVIAVMVAAAASFASPVGYQTNLMVFGPGGYRTTDYIRLGGPLSLIIGVITVIIAPIVWPF